MYSSLTIVALLVLGGDAEQRPGYSFEFLAPRPGQGTRGFGLSGSGYFAGSCYVPGQEVPCFWFESTPVLLSIPTGSTQGVGRRVNTHGLALGLFNGPPLGERSFVFQDGVVTFLTPLGGTRTVAQDLNQNGWVVGASSAAPGNPPTRAVLWKEPNAPLDLGTLGGSEAIAHGVTDGGTIVGHSLLPGDAVERGFVWEDGILTALPPLSSDVDSYALDANGDGLVVGASRHYENGFVIDRAVIWREGRPEAVDLPPNTFRSGLGQVNAVGQAIGARLLTSGPPPSSPFLWQAGRAFDFVELDPGPPGWTYSGGGDIDDSGQIVGWGLDSSGGATVLRSFLLTPRRSNFDRDADLDRDDVAAFTSAFAQGDARADWNSDGRLDALDRGAFLADWRAGR